VRGRKVATATLVPLLVFWVLAVAQAQHTWLSILEWLAADRSPAPIAAS
jgi:hypothetical protein